MFQYKRKVQYYETDKMGIVHHSNYVKWMEEARIALLDSIGLPYKAMEDAGIVSPVTAITLEYKSPCAFGDEVTVEADISRYNGVRLEVDYIMSKADGSTAVKARSGHCFLRDGKIVSLKHAAPEMHEKLLLHGEI